MDNKIKEEIKSLQETIKSLNKHSEFFNYYWDNNICHKDLEKLTETEIKKFSKGAFDFLIAMNDLNLEMIDASKKIINVLKTTHL